MTRKIRVGIVGTGGVARWQHIPGWKKIPDAEIVGVADISHSTAERVAKEFEIPRAFENFEDLLKLDLDIVDVCTPNNFHAPAAMAALNAGANVLCEKPLAVSTAEIRQMGELADKKNLRLMTAQHYRYTPEAITVRKWIEGGYLGDVYHSRVHALRRAWLPARAGFTDVRLSGGGPCMDIGVHALDTAMWFLNFPKPVRVSGTTKVNFAKGHKIPNRWGEWDRDTFSVEDFAAGYVTFENGSTMMIESSWLGHQKENEDFNCKLFGTDAGIGWPSMEYSSTANGTFVDGKLTPVKPTAPAHHDEIADFFRCVVAGLPSPVPWTETIKVIGILEAIYASAKFGREIDLSA